MLSGKQSDVFFGDTVEKCIRVHVSIVYFFTYKPVALSLDNVQPKPLDLETSNLQKFILKHRVVLRKFSKNSKEV